MTNDRREARGGSTTHAVGDSDLEKASLRRPPCLFGDREDIDHSHLDLPAGRADLTERHLERANVAAALPEHKHDPPGSASFNPVDPRFVITAGADGVARKALSSASFSADGKLVVTAGTDGVARVWDWPLEELKKALAAPEPTPLSSASFSPDGELVVTGGADGVARVWRWSRNEPLGAVTQPTAVTSTFFSSLVRAGKLTLLMTSGNSVLVRRSFTGSLPVRIWRKNP